jgi:hypothetical protein
MCLAVRHFFGPLASASFPSFVSNRALSSLQPRLLATDLKSSAPRYWAPCFPGSFLGTSGVIQVPSCDYVAFIDESGDPSVRRVKPLDYPGSSEWMTVSVVVIRAESEQHATPWVEAIISKTASSQMQRLHFSKLAPRHKRTGCEEIAKLPLRCFLVCSNKKNVRGWYKGLGTQRCSRNIEYNWASAIGIQFIHVIGYCDYPLRGVVPQ